MNDFWRTLVLAAIVAVIGAGNANAGNIVGGSSLVSAGDELQLEAWLGQGSLTLTNIFTKTTSNGNTSYDFHAAADGKGATFSVIEVLDANGFAHQVIGGYNPQSWDSFNDWHYIPADAGRTAFLFNLTNDQKFSEKLVSQGGYADGGYQTINYPNYGPTFGGGHDIYTDTVLSNGYNNQWSYGNPSTYNDGSLLGTPWNGVEFQIGTVEVFTISGHAVPEPSSFALLGLGGIGLAFVAYRRRRAFAV